MLDQNGWPDGFQQWVSAGASGASANSIAAHLVGYGNQRGDYPLDDGDFGRCEMLLTAAPSLEPRLSEMVTVNAYWEALVLRWDEIRNTDDQCALIKEIVKPIQDADPSHIEMSPGVHVRFGENSFMGKDAPESADPIDNAAIASRNKMEAAARKGRPPMKDDPDFRDHNDSAYRVTADLLRLLIERFERLEMEKKDIADQQKEVMAEAKGRGYDTKIIRKILALRKKSSDEIAEEEAILDMYKEALGMS